MKNKLTTHNKLYVTFLAFLASLGLNVDLSVVSSLDEFFIEGYPLSRYQEVNGNLSNSMMNIGAFFAGFSGNSIRWLCIFIGLCMLFNHSVFITNIRIKKYSLFTALAFSCLYVIGFSINKYSGLVAVIGSIPGFFKSIIALIGTSLTFYAVLTIFFSMILNFNPANINIKGFRITESGRKYFFYRCVVFFLCWLPYLIVYMPGFFLSDTAWQVSQALGDSTFSSHNPLFTTLLFGFFIRLGLLFRSANAGVFLYSVFQMLVCATAFSYVIRFMAKNNVHNCIRIPAFIFFALYPVNAFYAISMWKDTLFSVVFMLIVLMIIDIISNPDTFFSSLNKQAALALLCVLLFYTRHNGLYILAFIPVLVVYFRRYAKNLILIACICAVFYAGNQILSASLGASKGSVAEALSIPIQQISRTVREHGAELLQEDKDLISAVLPFEQLSDFYNPAISDPVKALFDAEAFSEDKSAYFSLWARLLIKYPVSYIEAFLCQSHGYWYPDIDEWIAGKVIAQNNYGIHFERIVPAVIDNIFSGIFVFRVFPALSMLISIGFAVWLTVLLIMAVLLKMKYYMLPAFTPVVFLWLTCMASPVSGQYRYIYGLFLTLPLLASLALGSNPEYDQDKRIIRHIT